jgi:hypothetical protein
MITRAWLGVLGAAMTLAVCSETYAPPPAAPVAAVGVAAPASAVAPACFRTHEIRNHTVGDDHTIYFNVSDRAVYRVEVDRTCLAGATTSDPIVTRNPPGADIVCRPIQLDLAVNTGGASQRCIVQSITPLTPAEVAALPPKLRP